jgi:alginate O-acetyltransferase complex protein AlgI
VEYSSLLFLTGFLPLFLLLYFLITDVGRRNLLLLCFSMLLIALVQPLLLLLILGLGRYTYRAGLGIKKNQKHTVILPVAVNLFALFLMRYLDLICVQLGIFAEQGGPILTLVAAMLKTLNGFGMTLHVPEKLVPIGFSLYILSSVSYLCDVYRGKCKAERSFHHLLLYFVLFPKFFQGPLVNYREVSDQIRERKENYRAVIDGAVRFCTGLGKKVLLADFCGYMIGIFAAAKSDLTLVGSWMTAVLYLFRIYYDFSGCCDMAVGLGKVLGFRFPENFNRPYLALSVTEFWERWNLTLRRFFSDYVYIPLKGRRDTLLNGFFAMLITVLLYAFWHGATFNFLLFALYFGLIMLIEKQLQNFLTDLPYWLRHTLTILCLMFGWVIFSHTEIPALANTIKAMIGEGGLNVPGDGRRFLNCFRLIIFCWIGVTSVPGWIRRFWRGACGVGAKQTAIAGKTIPEAVYLGSCVIYMVVILYLCVTARV